MVEPPRGEHCRGLLSSCSDFQINTEFHFYVHPAAKQASCFCLLGFWYSKLSISLLTNLYRSIALIFFSSFGLFHPDRVYFREIIWIYFSSHWNTYFVIPAKINWFILELRNNYKNVCGLIFLSTDRKSKFRNWKPLPKWCFPGKNIEFSG